MWKQIATDPPQRCMPVIVAWEKPTPGFESPYKCAVFLGEDGEWYSCIDEEPTDWMDDERPSHWRAFPEFSVSDIPYDERELIQRAINGASAQHTHACAMNEDDLRACEPVPRWQIVKRLFCCGSTAATLICHRYGYDPERTVPDDCQEIGRLLSGDANPKG